MVWTQQLLILAVAAGTAAQPIVVEGRCRSVQHVPVADVVHIPDTDVSHGGNVRVDTGKVTVPLAIDLTDGQTAPGGGELESRVGIGSVAFDRRGAPVLVGSPLSPDKPLPLNPRCGL